jgi:DNA-binding transcriptional ArsR family regulator
VLPVWGCSGPDPPGHLRAAGSTPGTVGELAQHLFITRSAVSQHLRVLNDGGLALSTAEGTRRIYRLNPDGVTALRAYLDRVWPRP